VADVFGLDFGTTSTLASRIVVRDGAPAVIDYPDESGAPHPSVVAYPGDRVLVGREAYALLDRADSGVIGDAVRSPKSYLGTGTRLTVAGIARQPRELVAQVIKHVVDDARRRDPERGFDQAVVTIPVDMDGRGRRELREAARDVGVHIHQFVHEPLAALYGFLRSRGDLERQTAGLEGAPILVVDWGGGTLDLTLCRMVGGTLVQFASRGEHRVGGDRFDELVRNLVRRRHAERHGLWSLDPLQVGAAARLLARCELAKKQLSERDDALIFVGNYLAVDGAASDIEEDVTKADLEEIAAHLLDRAMEGISDVLQDARIQDHELGLVLLTGGMSRMPLVRQRLQLAKPFELTLADDIPADLLPAGTALPVDENTYPERFPVHCVDPRDGRARFTLTRPVDPGRAQPLDPRRLYGSMQLPVDDELGPLEERLDLDVVVDSDLVVTVTARSQLSGAMITREIHELEFGLGVGPRDD
jgi:molecular chaperone DnaK